MVFLRRPQTSFDYLKTPTYTHTHARTHTRGRRGVFTGGAGKDQNMTGDTKANKQTEETSEIIRVAKREGPPTIRRCTHNSAALSESLKTPSVSASHCEAD